MTLWRMAGFSIALCCCGAALAATPQELFTRDCAVCHLPGIAGAPRMADKKEWSRRVRPGIAIVYLNAIEGIPYTAMTPKAGHTDIPDDEFKRIVDYMLASAQLDAEVLDAAGRYEKLGIRDRDFIRLDANYDGFLSRDEIAGDAALAASFARFDADRDGKLSAREYRNAETLLERERAAASVDDVTLVNNVRAALARVKGLDLGSMKVEAEAGTVSVVGIVSNAELAREAYGVVKRVPGIKKIDNRMVSGEQMGWD